MNRQMIRVCVISFTQNGGVIAERIKAAIDQSQETHITVTIQESRNLEVSLKEWCNEAFSQCQVLVFVGAAGIAVRLIAEFIKDKYHDPAVLVADELGRYVIPILSGHVGGGNAWAAFFARELGAVPVITTATDLQGKFAVDVFAAKNKLFLSDRTVAKEISAAVLRGETIGFFSEKRAAGKMPQELSWRQEDTQAVGKYNIYVGIHSGNSSSTLFLHPKALVLGVGCKKGTSMEEIEALVQETFHKENLSRHSVCGTASIDLKQQEQGLLEFCRKWDVPFHTYSSQQLLKAPGNYAESEFVRETVGVGNVCERAAMVYGMELMTQGFPKLIHRKTTGQGVALAVAELDWSVEFE